MNLKFKIWLSFVIKLKYVNILLCKKKTGLMRIYIMVHGNNNKIKGLPVYVYFSK